MSPIESILDALRRSTPDLPGALCRGSRGWDWDHDGDPPEEPEFRDARLARAAFTCRHRCPVLEGCRAYLESLPRAEKPTGAMAGRIIPGRPPPRQDRPKRRPRRDLGDREQKTDRSTA